MYWTRFAEKQPEVFQVNENMSVSRYYLVYSPTVGISYAHMAKTSEGKVYWVLGAYELEVQITHWLEANEP